jgi:hypothetical protein
MGEACGPNGKTVSTYRGFVRKLEVKTTWKT